MITDVMRALSGNNNLLFKAGVDCFPAIMDTLLPHLSLDWVCEASRII